VPTALEQQSSELVVYAARLVRAVRRRVGQPSGIRILALLDEFGPQGVTALAEIDRSSQPTVSGAVRQLVEQGLVAKDADPGDARWPMPAVTTALPSPSGSPAGVTPPRRSPPRSPSSAT
jgi:DNA-binding transcriptional ArsR family regulator